MTEAQRFLEDGLSRARRELAECEGFADFYLRRAAKLREEIRSAEGVVTALAAHEEKKA